MCRSGFSRGGLGLPPTGVQVGQNVEHLRHLIDATPPPSPPAECLGHRSAHDACSRIYRDPWGSGRYPRLPRGLGEGGVDQGPSPVDLVSRVEFGEQASRAVGSQDAGFVPAFEDTPGRSCRNRSPVPPGDPPRRCRGLEDKEDAGEDLAVIQRLASRKVEATLKRRWQQRLKAFPTGRR